MHRTRFLQLLLVFFLSTLFIYPAAAVDSQNVPHEIGGFTLGSDVSEYPDVIDTNFLKEMVVTDWKGFRKGIISYGTCKHIDKILKIRMKYEDSSKAYFRNLLEQFKDIYGPPHEWKGDSFGILHIWKWFFIDDQNRKVSLILQHNLRNPNENIGNMVKLSFPGLVKEERECFNDMCDQMSRQQEKGGNTKPVTPDLYHLIPR